VPGHDELRATDPARRGTRDHGPGARGEAPGSVALAWLLHQEGVTGPIIGPRTIGHLEDAQRAVALGLDDEVLKHLDTIFPGHRPAPEDYAW
jgi:aryl-alcohol dehydrogenase-like predicted oxidoreductase